MTPSNEGDDVPNSMLEAERVSNAELPLYLATDLLGMTAVAFLALKELQKVPAVRESVNAMEIEQLISELDARLKATIRAMKKQTELRASKEGTASNEPRGE
ncbi:hypothetical protein [Reyranella massiliensis]|uniref:hypothetical protein n=1 Tax=Reyranella massiliensis TaxID=445220 RepID=UPI0003071351|nr:hypothetical protein [Reyranella massiliensis]